jgi:hypothetical protein
MVHKRLLADGKHGRAVQECLFDELWEDTSRRIRGLGVNELSVSEVAVASNSINKGYYSFSIVPPPFPM